MAAGPSEKRVYTQTRICVCAWVRHHTASISDTRGSFADISKRVGRQVCVMCMHIVVFYYCYNNIYKIYLSLLLSYYTLNTPRWFAYIEPSLVQQKQREKTQWVINNMTYNTSLLLFYLAYTHKTHVYIYKYFSFTTLCAECIIMIIVIIIPRIEQF